MPSRDASVAAAASRQIDGGSAQLPLSIASAPQVAHPIDGRSLPVVANVTTAAVATGLEGAPDGDPMPSHRNDALTRHELAAFSRDDPGRDATRTTAPGGPLDGAAKSATRTQSPSRGGDATGFVALSFSADAPSTGAFEEGDASLEPVRGMPGDVFAVPRQIGTVTGQTPFTPQGRPQTPMLARHVAGQLTVALRNAPQGTTEMALDPVELGRVRMTIATQDQAVTMTILADRPETADLMRRHAEILQQEFRAQGYTSVTLDFGQRQGQAGAEPRHTGTNGAGPGEPDGPVIDRSIVEEPLLRRGLSADGGLDLRM